ncbi:MAG: response regulator [Lachnospiraceae bacterium]|nr:response regulator [Lachnospiraceae bacterium]
MEMKNLKKRISVIIITIAAFLAGCLFSVSEALAKDSFTADYIQTVYSQSTGFYSNEIKCLYQSASGYVWIGTESGLYRSNGAEFTSISLWDSDRPDDYSISCLYQDGRGRVWIGTENYGLFMYFEGSTTHFREDYYNGVKVINDVIEDAEGRIYVAAANGIYGITSNDDGYALKPHDIQEIASLKCKQLALRGTDVYMLSTDNIVYRVRQDGKISSIDFSDIYKYDLTTIAVIDDTVYVGTEGSSIYYFQNAGNVTEHATHLENIHIISKDSEGRIWVGADTGIGYLKESGLKKCTGCEIDSYISDMIQDYEGNYWIASSRMGLLYLSRSKFKDYNTFSGLKESMVNAVCKKDELTYIGTDDGLYIYDENGALVTDDLSTTLEKTNITDIRTDKAGNMYVSTARYRGVYKLSKNGKVSEFIKSADLPGRTINTILPLSDGFLACGTENGFVFADKTGKVEEDGGFPRASVRCIFETEDGRILVGTDGDGLYAFDGRNAENIRHYTVDDGLSSNVVIDITEGENGIYLATDDGITFYNESFRALSNIERANNVYDIKISDGLCWITGSLGVIYATESELIGSEPLKARYLSVADGLLKTVNNMGHGFVDNDGKYYICCNDGLYVLDTINIPVNQVKPRIKVTSVEVDGQIYEFDDISGGLSVSSDTSKITINFAVFSYANRSGISVNYFLEGFDKEPVTVRGNDALSAVYTNLDGGDYRFVISAVNGDGTSCEEPVSFEIVKDKSILENQVTRALLIALSILVLFLVILAGWKIARLIKSKNQAIEVLSKEHEDAVKTSSAKNDYLANISNEIKTPVNAMMAKADEALKNMDPESEYAPSIKGIYDIGADVLDRVDDIILLAKIEAGSIGLEEQNYSYMVLVKELSDYALEKLVDKGVSFELELGEIDADGLYGDYEKIKGIMERLLDNAVKFTKEGRIVLYADCEYENENNDSLKLTLHVSDTGIGIQEERVDTLFEVYNIADNKKNNPHSGNGVGLPIAKGYADLIDAMLTVESEYGVGTSFTLLATQKAGVKEKAVTAEKIEGVVSKETAESLWFPEVKALVVDDDDVSLELSVTTLKNFGIEVATAGSGMSAIDFVMNEQFDVCFIDLSMPVMNGVDTMKEIRELSDDSFATLPIVAMDMDAIEADKSSLLGEGFTDSIVKPMEPRRIAAILRDCLPESKISVKPIEYDITEVFGNVPVSVQDKNKKEDSKKHGAAKHKNEKHDKTEKQDAPDMSAKEALTDTPEEVFILSGIDIVMLEQVSALSKKKNYKAVNVLMKELCRNEYKGEDNDFMDALKAAVKKRDSAQIADLVNTYKALKE